MHSMIGSDHPISTFNIIKKNIKKVQSDSIH
jgi:hypothetical protein